MVSPLMEVAHGKELVLIVDCFTFWAELDVLEIRLTELYPVVDKFVLVEATRTHKGDEKPLHYGENRQRFARFNDKIRHIVVADLPEGTTQAAIWRREIGQRQAIERGLVDLPDDTLIMVSDLDEIPRREFVGALREQGMGDEVIYTFEQTLFYFNFNTAVREPSFRWNGTRATQLGNVRALTPDGIRWEGLRPRSSEYPIHRRVPNAGWHLSYFGDVAHIQNKMKSFLHQELVNADTLDPDAIAKRMAAGLDIWGREEQQPFSMGAATDLPWAVRADPARWLHYFHPDYRPVFVEDWYDPQAAAYVSWLAQSAPEGACVEIGSWEGKSAVCIAQSIQPRPLICVDHWKGNIDEGDEESIGLAKERKIQATFWRNMELLTPENVEAYIMDWRRWVSEWAGMNDPRIAFLHLDASHDYDSVADCLVAILPFLVPGAILCGDDYYADGVYRAVHDTLGPSVSDVGGRVWMWQRPMEEVK